MNEAEELLLGSIKTAAYNSKLEIKLLSSYCDMNMEEDTEIKDILLTSLNRIDDNLIKIELLINQIQNEEFI